MPSGCPEPVPIGAPGFHSVHDGALPCHQPDIDDRRRRRRVESRRDGTGDHSVPLQGIGCWCRREDSNLHGVLNPTRSTPWCADDHFSENLGAEPRHSGLPDYFAHKLPSSRSLKVSPRCHPGVSTNPTRNPLLPTSARPSEPSSEFYLHDHRTASPCFRKPGTPLGPVTDFHVPTKYLPGSLMRSRGIDQWV